MILSAQTLLDRLSEFFPLDHHDMAPLVNGASVDIRCGNEIMTEGSSGQWISKQLAPGQNYMLRPGELVLVSTLESVRMPVDCAADLRLKSTRAREGYEHSLAFWIDPGWEGILTMEIVNVKQNTLIPITPGLRIAQMIVYQLDQPSQRPYMGRYQFASGVEAPK